MLTIDDEHRYNRLGVEYASTTRVISSAGLMPVFSSTPEQQRYYMDRGTAIHTLTELHDRGTLDPSTVDPAIAGYLESWKKLGWTGDGDYIERMLGDDDLLYAGTIDRLPLLDIKSWSPAPWHMVQLGAYMGLAKANGLPRELWTTGTCVYLKGDGSMPTVVTYGLTDLQKGLRVFYSALNIYQTRKEFKLI